ncbi:hypothetical protein M8J77_013557 [Diaphorina citri]|nr:hypothetical protein M8J77_013557 [Diaphorina citri]
MVRPNVNKPNMSLIYMNGPQIEKQDNSTYPMLPPPGPKPNGTGLIGKKNIPVSPVQSLKTLSLFPSGLDHAYASNRSDKVTVEILTKEIQSLKQILTLHLNLIEQQSKKIELKDQELLALREEHEFLKKKNSNTPEPISLDLKPVKCDCLVKQIDSGTQTDIPDTESEHQSRTLPPVKKRRRTVSSHENINKQGKSLHRRATSENNTRDSNLNSSTSNTPHTQLLKKSKRILSKKSNLCQGKHGKGSVLTSCEEYFSSPEYWGDMTRSYNPNLSAIEMDTKPVTRSSRDMSDGVGCSSWLNDRMDSTVSVQVPSWRIVELSPLYDAEGTEDTSDAVYEKRHRKFELEEKRQRRWEEKEFRNQQYREKLKANRLRTARGREEKPKSQIIAEHVFKFFDPYQIEQIDIVDELPVIAFGNNMPHFKHEEFQLNLDLNSIVAERTNDRGSRLRRRPQKIETRSLRNNSRHSVPEHGT